MSAHLVARLAAWWPREPIATTLATSAPCNGCEAHHAVSVELHALDSGRAAADELRADCEHTTAVGWYHRTERREHEH